MRNDTDKRIGRSMIWGAAGSFVFLLFWKLYQIAVVRGGFPLGEMLQEVKRSFGDINFYLCFLFGAILLSAVIYYRKTAAEILFRYRFCFGLGMLALCVCMEINGSSIGMWNEYFGTSDDGLLFGVSRGIRVDEWACSTPMALSQYHDYAGKFSYFSHVIRGAATDVFLEYGQPVRDIAVIFRPFHWGYLFLPQGKGLAFYWCARLIALIVSSFEMGMYVTRGRKKLSLAYAAFISMAPVVHWWFAVNGLVEMLIYIQVSIVLLMKYMRTENSKYRLLYAGVIGICAGGYIFTMYPAWQVPLGFILLGLLVWTLMDNWKKCKMEKRDWIGLMVVGGIFLALIAYILVKSSDTIHAMLGTVYPGKRSASGGGYGFFVTNYLSNIWHAIRGYGAMVNVCESSQFIDLFPFCYILPGIVLFRDKIRDKLLITLTAVSIFLELWVIAGFPQILSKITLMSYSTAPRTAQVAGFVNVVLVVRALSLMKKSVSYRWAAAISGLSLAGLLWRGLSHNTGYWNKELLLITAAVFGVLFLCMLRFTQKHVENIFLFTGFGVLCVSTLLANPIRSGVDNIYELEPIQQISSVHEADPEALWVIEGLDYPYTNLGIMAGAPTVNSTNVYPNLERWEKLDRSGEYEDVYNRYAHIAVEVRQEGEPEFELLGPDHFKVSLTLQDLKDLNVKYIFTVNDLSYISAEELELLRIWNGYKIYKINGN